MLTPATFGLGTDVMASLPQGSGLQVGMVVQDPNADHYRMLVQCNTGASASLKVGGALRFISTTVVNYIVDMTSAAGQVAVGLNDIAGVVIPAGSYFWMTIKGAALPLVANGTTAGDLLVPTATAGVLGNFDPTFATNTIQQQANILGIAANASGSAAQVAAFIL